MKPIRSFLFILTCLALFIAVSYFLPLPQITTTNNSLPLLDSALLVPDSIESNNHLVDSILSSGIDNEPTNNELQFPSGDSTALFAFFRKLRNIQLENKPLRILYFGDSQIEGDRITATIRQFLQHKFGGAGMGLIPFDLLYSSMNGVSVDLSDNWQHFSIRDKNLKVHVSSLTFQDALLESGETGWLSLKQVQGNPTRYTRIRFFYQSSKEFTVTMMQRGKIVYQEKVNGMEEMSELQFNFSQAPDDVRFIFQANDNLKISALSLESPSGILVDNIALRGFSFPPYSKLDKKTLEQTIKLLNPGLVVLHFGVNLVPYQRNEYSFYRRKLVSEIRYLQQMMPDVPFFIVGISDMAQKVGDEMVSYPNIKAIKKAQREAAIICKIAYWDLENYMGGTGAMARWVDGDPKLGKKDYIHFSDEGTEKIGKHLSKILLDEYEKFKTDTVQ